MNTVIQGSKVSIKEKYVLALLLIIGIIFILFVGNQQMSSLKNNPLPAVNKTAQEQCFADLRAQHIDVSGVNGALCRGK